MRSARGEDTESVRDVEIEIRRGEDAVRDVETPGRYFPIKAYMTHAYDPRGAVRRDSCSLYADRTRPGAFPASQPRLQPLRLPTTRTTPRAGRRRDFGAAAGSSRPGFGAGTLWKPPEPPAVDRRQ